MGTFLISLLFKYFLERDFIDVLKFKIGIALENTHGK